MFTVYDLISTSVHSSLSSEGVSIVIGLPVDIIVRVVGVMCTWGAGAETQNRHDVTV